MTTPLAITSAYPRYADTDGSPLEGKLYFGVAGQNPITNPTTVYWDAALTQPAALPLTVSGGYIIRQGSPAGLFTSDDYSILAQDTKGRTVFYATSSSLFDNLLAIQTSLAVLGDFPNTSDMNKGVALIGGAGRVVGSIATLRTLPKTGAQTAFVTGYYAPGDGGGGAYYYDSADTSSADNGGSVIVAADGGRWKLSDKSVLSLRQFGAKGDSITADDTPLSNWFAAIKTHRVAGYIPKGQYKITMATTWDFSTIASVGCRIYGDGPNECKLDFSSVSSGVPFKWVGTVALFYMTFANFSVLTNYNGVGFQIGQTNYSDAWNSCRFDKLIVNNSNPGANNVGVQLNYVLQSIIDIVANGGGTGRPGQPSTPGYGTAMQLRQCAFNHFFVACGNAKKGLHITGGFTYANTFSALDIEEVDTAITIDSAEAKRNTFINGTYVATTIFNCTAGQANVFQNPNISPYGGGVEFATGGSIGVLVEKYQQGGVATPTLPASGTPYQNISGRQVMVWVSGGNLTGINILKNYGGSAGIPGVLATCPNTLILDPMDTITLTYGASPPSWLWLPIS